MVSGFLEFLELFWIFLVLETYLKNPLVLELFLNSKFFPSTFFIATFPGAPCLDLLSVMKYCFNSAQGNLNNRSSYRLTVGPDWRWMSLSKLPCVLDALGPIIVTPDHFPVLSCTLCFCCIFFFLLAFTVKLPDIISFHQLYYCKSYLIVKDDIQLFAKVTGKVHILVFWEVYSDTWYKPLS